MSNSIRQHIVLFKVDRNREPIEIVDHLQDFLQSASRMDVNLWAVPESHGQEVSDLLANQDSGKSSQFGVNAFSAGSVLESSEVPINQFLSDPFSLRGDISLFQLYAEMRSFLPTLFSSDRQKTNSNREICDLFLLNGSNFEIMAAVLSGTPVEKIKFHYFGLENGTTAHWILLLGELGELQIVLRSLSPRPAGVGDRISLTGRPTLSIVNADV